MALDLPFAFRQSESRTPIVLLYRHEANMVEKLVIEGSQKRQVCTKLPRQRLGAVEALMSGHPRDEEKVFVTGPDRL